MDIPFSCVFVLQSNTGPVMFNQTKTAILNRMSRLVVNKNSYMIHSGNFTI